MANFFGLLGNADYSSSDDDDTTHLSKRDDFTGDALIGMPHSLKRKTRQHDDEEVFKSEKEESTSQSVPKNALPSFLSACSGFGPASASSFSVFRNEFDAKQSETLSSLTKHVSALTENATETRQERNTKMWKKRQQDRKLRAGHRFSAHTVVPSSPPSSQNQQADDKKLFGVHPDFLMKTLAERSRTQVPHDQLYGVGVKRPAPQGFRPSPSGPKPSPLGPKHHFSGPKPPPPVGLSLVPSKKSRNQLQQIREKERPWTVDGKK